MTTTTTNSRPKRRAIFLDRDGVINRDRPDFVKTWSEFEFTEEALAAIRELSSLPCAVVIISNQSGIGRGLMTEETLLDIHRRMLVEIAAAGGRIDAIYYCPHHPGEGCACRKPMPGLVQAASREMNLDLEASWLIGDDWRDVQAAHAAGVRSILLDSPKSRKPVPEGFPEKARYERSDGFLKAVARIREDVASE